MNKLKKILEAGGSISEWQKLRRGAEQVESKAAIKGASDEVASANKVSDRVDPVASEAKNLGSNPMKLEEIITTTHQLDAAGRAGRATSIKGLDDSLLSMEKGLIKAERIEFTAGRTQLTLAEVGKKLQSGEKVTGGDWGAYKNYFSSNYAQSATEAAAHAPSGGVRMESNNSWFKTAAEKISEMRNEGAAQTKEFNRVKEYIGASEFKNWKSAMTSEVGFFERNARKLMVAGAAALGFTVWQGLDSAGDPNDDILSPIQRIEYKMGLAATGLPLVGEYFTNRILTSKKEDPVSKAQRTNLATAAKGTSEAKFAETAAAANLAPPTDLKAALSIGSKRTEPTKQEEHTFDPTRLESNLNHLVEDSYIRPDEKTELLTAWKSASKTASPAEVFQGNAIEILSKPAVGRDKEAVDYVSKMVLGQNTTPNQSR